MRTRLRLFIVFGSNRSGEFAFGHVQGFIDHRLLKRDGKPGVEWTWHGDDEMDEAHGRGWAVLHDDRMLRGALFFDQGDELEFVARKIGLDKAGAFGPKGGKMTDRQGQFLAFIHHYTTLHRRVPAEADMQKYFGITPPSVHQMVLTLEKKKYVERSAGVARSIRVLLPPDQLPGLRR